MGDEKEYVFVVSENESAGISKAGGCDLNEHVLEVDEAAVEIALDDAIIEEVPHAVPFLPALDASTEITKYEGYSDAVSEVQSHVDARLLAFSQFLKMSNREDVVLTPHRRGERRSSAGVFDLPVTVCMGWQRVSGVSSHDREVLRVLEEEGVSYMPHDTSYSVKYLAPVAPYGDCLFLSMEQLLLHSEECEPLPPHEIRRLATRFFLAHYEASTEEEKKRIDTTIRNLNFPSLNGGWGISPLQTRRYVALRKDKATLKAKCYELQRQGYSWCRAAETVYSQYAQPVVNAQAYCEYMAVGNGDNTHFLIGLNYSQRGLVSVDDDPDNCRVAWGDDIVLEALATAYQRDIFVVLIGCGKMFFLPHRPHPTTSSPGVPEPLCRSKGNAPWFLLMRSTGAERGGDHYEPMFAERLRGDGSEEFGNIGD